MSCVRRSTHRYGFMMRLGSVILKVDSLCVADQMWYFPLLKPYYDHVPVKADLSDLYSQIMWCRAHDDECHKIAQNAKEVYSRYIGRAGILDYMQSVFVEIAEKWQRAPAWMPPVPIPAPAPPMYPGARSTICCMPRCDDRCEHDLCSTCLLSRDKENKELAIKKEQAGLVAEGKVSHRDKLRARMTRKALEEAAAIATTAAEAAGATGVAGRVGAVGVAVDAELKAEESSSMLKKRSRGDD